MNPFMFFVFICTVIVVSYILGNRIGYLQGKAEVSHIPRGELPESTNDLNGTAKYLDALHEAQFGRKG